MRLTLRAQNNRKEGKSQREKGILDLLFPIYDLRLGVEIASLPYRQVSICSEWRRMVKNIESECPMSKSKWCERIGKI